MVQESDRQVKAKALWIMEPVSPRNQMKEEWLCLAALYDIQSLE
jgi:hypothetical protein